MVPRKSTAEEVSFEWSHHRISSTDSKSETTLHVSGGESIKSKLDGTTFVHHCHRGLPFNNNGYKMNAFV